MSVVRSLAAFALLACGPGNRGPCDASPTGISRHVQRLPFVVPAGLMPDPQFDGLPAELAVNVVRPVYSHGRCAAVASHAAVLVHGRVLAAAPSFDVRATDAQGRPLSLQEVMAWAGIDTYAPDLLGYGGSTRFAHGLDDPCNASLRSCADPDAPFPEGCDASVNPIFSLDQQGRELGKRCAHSSSVRFAGTDVWVRDLRQVVGFALDDARPGGGKVTLLGYSAGGLRVGRALDERRPDGAWIVARVSRAIFLASLFGGPTDEPSPPPAITFPMTLARPAAPPPDPPGCEGRTIPGIGEQQWAQALEEDPIGRSWGASGVVRAPTFSTYGWNEAVAGALGVPALILQGLDDTTLGQPPLRGNASACAIYRALPRDKVVVRLACATHAILVQRAHTAVAAAVIEWVKQGTFHGQRGGSFVVDGARVTSGAPCPN